MTVVEVSIASALLLAVLAMFLGVLMNLTSAEKRTEALIDNEQEVRFVLQEMGKDIRQSNPMIPLSPKTLYQTRLEVEIGPEAGPRERIRWFYDTNPGPNYQTLQRQVINPATGLPTSTVVKLTRVRNNDLGTPLFGYFGQSGRNLGTDASVSATEVGTCTIRLQLIVRSDSNPGPQPFTEALDVHLRNRLPGGLGCGF